MSQLPDESDELPVVMIRRCVCIGQDSASFGRIISRAGNPYRARIIGTRPDNRRNFAFPLRKF